MNASTQKLAHILRDPNVLDALPMQEIPVLRGELAKLDNILFLRMLTGTKVAAVPSGAPFGDQQQYEIIDSHELARRWNVPETWVRECVRKRSADAIPCIRFGRYVRFEWGSSQLEAWCQRHRCGK